LRIAIGLRRASQRCARRLRIAEWNHPATAGASAQIERVAAADYRLAHAAALV
jgi:hypothetical protein